MGFEKINRNPCLQKVFERMIKVVIFGQAPIEPQSLLSWQTFISYHHFPPLVPECDHLVEPVKVKRNEVFLRLYQ
jgi:hypothetical protein